MNFKDVKISVDFLSWSQNINITTHHKNLYSVKTITPTDILYVKVKGWFKEVVDWVFSRLDCVYGVQSNMC